VAQPAFKRTTEVHENSSDVLKAAYDSINAYTASVVDLVPVDYFNPYVHGFGVRLREKHPYFITSGLYFV